MNGYKRNFIADIPSGTLTLANGDKGKVASPCADYGNMQKERTIDLDVRNALLNYGGRFRVIYHLWKKMKNHEKSDKLNEDGKLLTPKNGLD